MDAHALRKRFFSGMIDGLRVVWPVLSGLLAIIVALGLAIGLVEDWTVQESIYFAFVSGLTIGYGDFSPTTLATRTMAIAIGVCGILLTAVVAAVAVKALTTAMATSDGGR
jgi:hypothetical protein